MARRPNYGFEKRQKELERQKKKDAKAERRDLRRQEADNATESVAAPDEAASGAGDPS